VAADELRFDLRTGTRSQARCVEGIKFGNRVSMCIIDDYVSGAAFVSERERERYPGKRLAIKALPVVLKC
jgi:hypothetical protein